MRILLVSASPIQKEVSIGNTFLNLFSGMEDVELASVCTRAGTPDPSVSQCFCITEKMLIRNLLGKGPAGTICKRLPVSEQKKETSSESSVKRFVKTKRWNIFFFAQNLLWTVGRWKSPQLRAFIEDFQPDVIFTTLSNKRYLNRLILHIAKLANARLFVYAWDNNYSLKRLVFSPFDWIGHFCNRHYMRKVVKKADKLYVISDVQKEDYEKAFRKSCTVITKAEDFSEEPQFKAAFSEPLQLVYTGNLYANRWKSLGMLVNALENINRNGVKAQLRIYTATPLTDAMTRALHVEDTSFLMGKVPSSEVLRIQQDADILVHAEAMDLKNRLTVRQSFSTKIVDYLKAARPILAVGPKEVASVKYFIDYNCAIVADNEIKLYEKLSAVIDDKQQLHEYAAQAYMCGRMNHDKKRQEAVLKWDLCKLKEM